MQNTDICKRYLFYESLLRWNEKIKIIWLFFNCEKGNFDFLILLIFFFDLYFIIYSILNSYFVWSSIFYSELSISRHERNKFVKEPILPNQWFIYEIENNLYPNIPFHIIYICTFDEHPITFFPKKKSISRNRWSIQNQKISKSGIAIWSISILINHNSNYP